MNNCAQKDTTSLILLGFFRERLRAAEPRWHGVSVFQMLTIYHIKQVKLIFANKAQSECHQFWLICLDNSS